jgi:hypothetical protein
MPRVTRSPSPVRDAEAPARGEALRAVCLGCGLERSEPTVMDSRLSVCLACGDTRVVFDQRAAPAPADSARTQP